MTHPLLERQRRFLADCRAVADRTPLWSTRGKLVRVTGMVMEAVGLKLPVGSACSVALPDGGRVEAEVVGFAGDKVFLMPLTNVQGLLPGSEVRPLAMQHAPA